MSGSSHVLAEQRAYYRAIADEYEDHPIDLRGRDELVAAVEAFRPTGDVLELACGSGMWTEHLLRSAKTVTAVDAAPEMLARAAARVGSAPVRFVEADLFSWRPDRRYDAVFFGFWLSHVPPALFDSFWSLVDDCLSRDGCVFFCDDNYRTEPELVEGVSSPVVERRLNDGRPFRVIKVPYQPAELERQLRALGWDIAVTASSGPFYWGLAAVRWVSARRIKQRGCDSANSGQAVDDLISAVRGEPEGRGRLDGKRHQDDRLADAQGQRCQAHVLRSHREIQGHEPDQQRRD